MRRLLGALMLVLPAALWDCERQPSTSPVRVTPLPPVVMHPAELNEGPRLSPLSEPAPALFPSIAAAIAGPLGTQASMVIGPPDPAGGAGSPHIVWEHAAGTRGYYEMSGTTVRRWVAWGVVSTELRIAGTGDFTCDGTPDVIIENTRTGARWLWRMTGATPVDWIPLGMVTTDWQIVGAADLTGDGKPDILWEQPSTGYRGMYRMDCTRVVGWIPFGVVSKELHIAGAGAADFTDDGQPDVPLENTRTGERWLWRMQGVTPVEWIYVGTASTALRVVGIGDFTRDGQADLVFENTQTGERWIWPMQRSTPGTPIRFATIPSDWHITGTLPAQPFYRLRGLNFSPFVDGQNPDYGSVVTEDQIRIRLGLTRPFTEWVRAFGSTGGLQHAGRIAHVMGLKAACSAWIGRDGAANQTEIAALISTARAGYCDMAIVGSEALLRGDVTVDQLVEYIQQVRAAGLGIPVTAADVHDRIRNSPQLIAAVDVLMVNYYPYWEGVALPYAVAYIH